MTLPGIAGFILTIGMGVDSNVLIFERIREELATKKGAQQALAAGFDRVFLDDCRHARGVAHLRRRSCSSSAPGRFAGSRRRCSSGLMANVFTAVFVSRTLFEFLLSRKPAGSGAAQHLTETGAIHAISGQQELELHEVALARAASVRARDRRRLRDRHQQRGGLPLGVDFSGGTAVLRRVQAADRRRERPVGAGALASEACRAALRRRGTTRILVRLPITKAPKRATSLEEGAKRVEAALPPRTSATSGSSRATSSARSSART